MKSGEILQKLDEIRQGFGSLEVIKQKLDHVDQLIANLEHKTTELAPAIDKAQEFMGVMEKTTSDATALLERVQEVVSKVEEYQAIIGTQKQEFDTWKEQVDNLQQQITELWNNAKKQLRLITDSVLSTSFERETDPLQKSVKGSFLWLVGLTVILSVVAFWFVIRELPSLLKDGASGFELIVRTVLFAPLVYLVVFISRHHGRDKRMLEEYKFKTAVALSLEAYRKIVRDEITSMGITDEKKQEKIVNFIVGSIEDIYSSPMANIVGRGYKEEDEIRAIVRSMIPGNQDSLHGIDGASQDGS